MSSEHGIGTRTLRGMAWAYGAYVGGRIVVLASTSVLARLLVPRDFGLVAIALILMTFMDAIQDLGLGEALIVSKPGEEDERAQTVFSWTVLISLLLSVATFLLAPLIADFFHQPGVRWIVAAIGSVFLLRSLGATHYAIARKELNYRVRTASELTEVVLRGVIGIVLAILGFGAWSLTIGFIVGVAASSLVLIRLVDFRPRLRLTHHHLKNLVTFGGTITLVDFAATFAYNLDYIFTGRILGAASLGLYTIGFRLPELIILNLANVASDVLFPAYSAVDRQRMREAFLVALRYTTMATLPAAVALILLARPITLVVFGSQWIPSIQVMQIITVYSFIVTLTIPSGSVFKATGRGLILFLFGVPYIPILIVGLELFTHDGIGAVAWTTTGLQAAVLPIYALVTMRQLGVSLGSIIRAVAPTVVAAAGMAAVVFSLKEAISIPALAVLAGGVIGLAVYVGLLFLVSREALERLRAMAFPAATSPS